MSTRLVQSRQAPIQGGASEATGVLKLTTTANYPFEAATTETSVGGGPAR